MAAIIFYFTIMAQTVLAFLVFESILVFDKTLRGKNTPFVRFIVFMLLHIVVIAAGVISLNYVKIQLMIMIRMIGALYIVYLYFCLFTTYRKLKNLIIVIIYFVIFVTIDLTCGFIINNRDSISNFETYYMDEVYRALASMVFLVAFSVVYLVVFLVVSVVKNRQYRNRSWYFILFPLSQSVLFVSAFYMAFQTKNESLILLVSIGTFLLVLTDSLVVNLFIDSVKKVKLEEELWYTEQEKQMNMEMYNRMIQTDEQWRKTKHDFTNILAIIQSTKSSHDESAAKEGEILLKELQTEIDSYIIGVYCKNILINAIITNKATQAKGYGIRFVTDIDVGSRIGVSNKDTCSIFMNLLDNAITACKDEDIKNRQIAISTRSVHNMLYIRVENPIEYAKPITDSTGHYLSTKPDKQNHGRGLKIVQSIASQYNGEVIITSDNDTFCVTVSMMVS